MRTVLALLTLLAPLALTSPARAIPADDAGDICSPAANPCVVAATYEIANGATLDFGSRALVFDRLGRFDVFGGSMDILAGSVTLKAEGGPCALAGASGTVRITAQGDVQVQRAGNTAACIDVKGDPGGDVDITAGGNVVIQGVLEARSTVEDNFGGDVVISGLQVTLDLRSEVSVRGGQITNAGSLDVDAPAGIVARGRIDGMGGDGGEVILTSLGLGGDVVISNEATIELQARIGGGFGGGISIDAEGSATLGGTIRMRGESSGEDVGDAGAVDVLTGVDIFLTAQDFDLTGVPPDGAAGSVDFDAGRDIVLSQKIDAAGNGLESSGGAVLLVATRNLTLDAIDVSGGTQGSGGSVDAEAWCGVSLPRDRTVRAEGPAGLNRLASGGQITIEGSLRAGLGNTLEYRSALPIVTATGSLVPTTPGNVLNANLTPCGGFPVCGNEALEIGEPCDGDLLGTCSPGQICTSDCVCTSCGNGTIDPGEGEECDPAVEPNDGCPAGEVCAADCSACQQCGDGMLDGAEVCDGDAGPVGPTGTCNTQGQSCKADCTGCEVLCGDGRKHISEVCDDGNTDSCDGCNATCTRVDDVCGDNVRECGEVCDRGDTGACDGCAPDCSRIDGVCGDGVPECGEGGDDGNLVSCDGVSAACQLEGCGNGVVECGEGCDDGPQGSATCRPDCTIIVPPNCGDGILQPDQLEVCDDGNRNDCDGCRSTCLRADNLCGDRLIDAECGEQCDVGDQMSGDGCSPTCRAEICGNGILDPGELCDLGARNGQSGSTCGGSCGPLPTCTAGSTETCIPCATYLDCDPLGACGGAACSAGVCTPVVAPNCDDQNPCTAGACDPASGCVQTPLSGPQAGCGDDDACTDDACSAGACTSRLKPGLPGASCRLGALQALIDSAADIPKATRKKLKKLAKRVAKQLPIAAGSGRKADKALKQVDNGLRALGKTVTRAEKKIGAGTVSELNALINGSTLALTTLRL